MRPHQQASGSDLRRRTTHGAPAKALRGWYGPSVTARTVFLSRTSEFAKHAPNRSYVAAAKAACNTEDCLPRDMTGWTATPRPPAEECRQRVRACDVYVGIIGFSYGSPVSEEPERSYTELEYEAAKAAGMETYVFLLAEDGDMPPGLVLGEARWAERQTAFRRRLEAENTVASFRNADDLQRLVADALRSRHLRPRHQRPYMVPPGPAALVERPEELAAVVQQIRRAVQPDQDEASARPPIVALHGAGGFGKTTLAGRACRRLRDELPDGVLWVELGEHPSEQRLVESCRNLVLLLEERCPAFTDARTAGAHLGSTIGDRRLLLVVDDVWRARDLEPFLHGAPSTVRLVTSRVRSVLPYGTPVVAVDQLTDREAEDLLTRGLPDADDVDWSELLRRTGNWPLLAQLVNSALLHDVEDGLTVEAAAGRLARALRARGPTSLDPRHDVARDQAVAATVEASLSRLDGATVELFRDLAVFAEDEDVPLAVLGKWRRLDEHDLPRLAADLRDLSLVQAYDAAGTTVRLHDVLRQYMLAAEQDRGRARHASLLAAHRPVTGRWAELSHDCDYLWRRLALHLQSAGLSDELAMTVRDLAWLARVLHEFPSSVGLEQLQLAQGTQAAGLLEWARRWHHLLPELSSAADVAATLLARPGGLELVTCDDDGPVVPALRYAAGWSSPEPTGSALDRVVGTHHDRVHAMAWDHGGRRLASVGGDGTVRVWDIDGGAPPDEIGGSSWVTAVAWSPDGDRLVYGDLDGAVRLHALDGHEDPVEIGRHEGPGVRVVSWSPDGTRVASGADDGVRVWSLAGSWSTAPVGAVRLGGGSWVRALAWSPDGRRLAFGDDDGAVWVWSGAGSPRLRGRHEGEVFSVTWSGDGRPASCGADGALRLWSDDGSEPFELKVPGGSLRAVSPSPAGDHIATGSADGRLRVWAADRATEPVELGRHEGGALTVAWRPASDRVLTSGGCDGEVRLWQVDGSDGRLDLPGPQDRIAAVAWSPDGRRLAAACGDGSVQVWPAEGGGRPVEVGRHGGSADALAWLGTTRRLASGSDDGEVVLWPLSADGRDRPAVLEARGGRVRALAAPAPGTALACVDGDGGLQVWRPRPDGQWVMVDRRGDAAGTVAWSPDGQRLLTGDDDGGLRLWNIGGGGPALLGRREHRVRAVAWSPDGRSAAAGDEGGTLLLWDLDSHEAREVGRHAGGVHAASFSPEGRRLLTVGCDGRVQVWPAAPSLGRQGVSSALALTGVLSSAAWQPHGERVAVGGSYGVHVFDVQATAAEGAR